MHDVTTKRQFYQRWVNNEFGNRFRVWRTVQEINESGYTGLVGVRYMVPNSPYLRYGVPRSDVPKVTSGFVERGADPSLFTLGEMAPDDGIVIQGELIQTEEGTKLFYSTVSNKQMRDALRIDGRTATGVAARMILAYYLDPCDHDELNQLLDLYPFHAIEFSAYNRRVGLYNKRMVIWEVRKY